MDESIDPQSKLHHPKLKRLSHFERFLRLFTSVRPGEGRSVLYLFFTAFLLMAAYYLLRPVRDALILAEGSAEIRAYAQGIVAVTLIFLLPLYKQLFEGLADPASRSRVLRWVTAFFISNLLIFYLMGRGGLAISVPFFVWLSIFNVSVLAQFWAFAADLFNVRSGQRLFVVIMVGASSGAWVGSQGSKHLVSVIGHFELMLLASAVLIFPIILSAFAERSVPSGSANPHQEPLGDGRFTREDLVGGFDVVFRSRYLISIAALIVVLNYVNTAGEYVLAWFADRQAETVAMSGSVSETQYLARFYGDYNAWFTLISLVVQLFIVTRIFRWVGVRGAMLVLPVLLIINYAVLLILPLFGLVRLLMIAEKSVTYSVQNTTNQALYLPLTREQKNVGKMTIETFFVRAADAVHAGVIYLLVGIAGLGIQTILGINLCLALVALAIAFDIRRHHRRVSGKRMPNLPPRVASPLPDVYVPAGQLLVFSVPERSFLDPDPGDTLEYRAFVAGREPLPEWVEFDRHNQTFTVRPPDDEGWVEIEVIARDFEGLEVSDFFVIGYGPGKSPVFAQESAWFNPAALGDRGVP